MADPKTILNLAAKNGFTPIGDSKYSAIQDFIPTFIPELDKILGGGIPFGRISEVFAPEAVGKSTFMIYLTRIAVQLGVTIFWIDTEGTSDPERMEELSVDTGRVYVLTPDENSGESMSVELVQAKVEAIINMYDTEELKDQPVLVIWDSVGGTVTKAEQDLDAGEQGQRGRQAAAVTTLIRKVTPMIKDINMAFLVVNQVRDNQNKMGLYDKQYTRPGGRALDHSESLRLELRKSGQIKNRFDEDKDESKVGHMINVITDKSKISRPGQSTKIVLASGWVIPETRDATYGHTVQIADGIDYEYNVFNTACNLGVIEGSSWKSFTDPSTGEIIKYQNPRDWVRRLKQDKDLLIQLGTLNTAVVFRKERPAYLNNKHIDICKWDVTAPIADYFDQHEEIKDTIQETEQALASLKATEGVTDTTSSTTTVAMDIVDPE